MDDLEGMTTNERLFVAGLMRAFEEAKARRDRSAMIELLCRVQFPQSSAEWIADRILERVRTPRALPPDGRM
jgi:hypothetical protein